MLRTPSCCSHRLHVFPQNRTHTVGSQPGTKLSGWAHWHTMRLSWYGPALLSAGRRNPWAVCGLSCQPSHEQWEPPRLAGSGLRYCGSSTLHQRHVMQTRLVLTTTRPHGDRTHPPCWRWAVRSPSAAQNARSWTCIQLRRCNYGDHVDSKCKSDYFYCKKCVLITKRP